MTVVPARRAAGYALAAVLLTAVGVVRIVRSSAESFQTHDEPFHVACGLLWIENEYPYACLDQPPLARVAAAIPLALDGMRAPHTARRMYVEGSAILRAGGAYERNLARARVGQLVFFVGASVVVWLWTRRLYGEPAALAAVFLFQGLPSVLAHSAIAMTDMALAATLAAALFLLVRWWEDPKPWRAVLCGVAAGLAVLSKHSALPYLATAGGAISLAAFLSRRPDGLRAAARERWKGIALGAAALFLVVWAGYRFWARPLALVADRPHRIDRALGVDRWKSARMRSAFQRLVETPVPAADLFFGLEVVRRHIAEGHTVYFDGEIRTTGWRRFFPMMLTVKTPIPFLVLLAAGCVVMARRRAPPLWQRLAPLLAAAPILALAIPARINLGLRHVLPMYPLLAIEAGLGLASLWGAVHWRGASRAVAIALAVWFAWAGWRAHPDYLSYFNELVKAPERLVVDSDFELGQDVRATLREASRRGVAELHFWCRDCEYLAIPGLSPLPGAPAQLQPLEPYRPVTGWVAISESTVRLYNETLREPGRPDRPFDWLLDKPFERVGKTMRLYRAEPK